MLKDVDAFKYFLKQESIKKQLSCGEININTVTLDDNTMEIRLNALRTLEWFLVLKNDSKLSKFNEAQKEVASRCKKMKTFIICTMYQVRLLRPDYRIHLRNSGMTKR